MFGTFLFSLALLGLSGFLLDLHRRSWQRAMADSSGSTHELRYSLAQYRRRTQASGIIGILGVAVGVSPIVPHRPWPMAIYLASISGACLAIVVLAAIDAWATRQYYTRLRNERLAEQVKLVGELRQRGKSPSRNSSIVLKEIAE